MRNLKKMEYQKSHSSDEVIKSQKPPEKPAEKPKGAESQPKPAEPSKKR